MGKEKVGQWNKFSDNRKGTRGNWKWCRNDTKRQGQIKYGNKVRTPAILFCLRPSGSFLLG